jgi:KUP system potassium uptake protein
MLRIPEGGWFPLVVAGAAFAVMTTWKKGRLLLANGLAASSLPWESFLADVQEAPPHRVPGTAVFMYGNPDGTPPALLHMLQHFRVLHEHVVILRVDTAEVPHVPGDERVEVEALDDGFYRVTLDYGFMESPSVPHDLVGLHANGLDLSPERTTCFLGRETLIAVRRGVGMPLWRDRLLAYMARNALCHVLLPAPDRAGRGARRADRDPVGIDSAPPLAPPTRRGRTSRRRASRRATWRRRPPGEAPGRYRRPPR